MDITPHRLADLLLSFPINPDAPPRGDMLDPIREGLKIARDHDAPMRIMFWEESAALYFLRVLENFKSLDVSSGKPWVLPLTVYHALWIRFALESAAGARFYRHRSLENQELSLHLLELLSKLPVDLFSPDSSSLYVVPFSRLLNITIATASQPFNGSSQEVLPISLSHAVHARLRERRPLVLRLIEQLRASGTSMSMDPNALSLTNLEKFMEGRPGGRPVVDSRTASSRMFVWKSCELLRDGEDKSKEEGVPQCGEGVEMMACGRCLAVRYCCKGSLETTQAPLLPARVVTC